ncbi:MAG: hypothetical protein N2738_01605 [Thermodesulfovibrionales bacterium]|nr:hypothetical protein [Thermodesulfovibrionales bacterium]
MEIVFLLLIIFLPTISHGEDIKGLQPFQPFGVFSTFSADSLQKKELGLSVSLERSKAPDFYRITVQGAYAFTNDKEIHLNLPYFLKYEQDIYGFEDLTVGFKHRVIDEGKFNPAIAYIVAASPGLGRSDFSTDGRIGGGFIATKKIGPFKGHANLIFYQPFKSGLNREYLLNLGAELAITHSSKVLAELIGRKNYYINRLDLLEWRLGFRQETFDNVFTTVGAGFDIKDRKPDYRFLFSLSFVIPTEKKQIQRIYEN